MTDPDPVIATLSAPSPGRNKLRDLVAAALYDRARREHEAERPDADPAAYAATWTPSRIEGLRDQAAYLIDADARARRGGPTLASLAGGAVLGALMLFVLSGVALFGLRAAGIDVAAALMRACEPEAPPRYVGQGR